MTNDLGTCLQKENSRNCGIDLLKLVSMFMVVQLHTLSAGALISASPMTLNYEAGFLMEALTYCCVNCFALASGYIGVNTQFKYRRIIPIWLEVVFYNVLCTVIFAYIKQDVSVFAEPAALKRAFFPVINKSYWYFTAYFALFFFIPYLNMGLSKMREKQALALILSVICVYIAIPYFSKQDLYSVNNGYSAVWLILLYATGAALKKINIKRYVKRNWVFLVLYIVFAVLAWAGKYVTEYKTASAGSFASDRLFINYTSLPIFLSSISLVLFFAELNIKNVKFKKAVRYLAPAAFGVYIIHTNSYVFSLPMWGNMAALASKPWYIMILSVFRNAVVIYAVCIFIDLIRIQLFRLLRIGKIIEEICSRAHKTNEQGKTKVV